MRTVFLSCLIFVIVIGGWQVTSELQWVSPMLLPSPVDIARYLIDAIFDGTLISALFVTIERLLIGYTIGLGLGILLGVLLFVSAVARNSIGLLALGLQTLPSVCWAPLALLWFGYNEAAMYFVVIMGSMWAVAIASETAIQSVSALHIQAAKVMGASVIQIWKTVIFPASLPALVGGAKLGWAFAWRSLMAAEIYVAIVTRMGIGQLLHFSRELHAMDQAMGIMIVIILIGLLVDRAIFLPLEIFFRQTRGVSLSR